MKNLYTFWAFAFLILFLSKNASAQKSQIMDARIDITPSGSQYTGQLSVFLTDTVCLSGLTVQLGATPGDTSLYQASYAIGSGSTFYTAGGTLSATSTLQISLGNFAYHPDYYALVTILRRNGKTNQIAVHSSN